jgi:hypothetical protein
MTGARKGAIVVLALRIAYGAGLIAAPSRLGRRWLGPAANAAPTQVPLGALGPREIILHSGAMIAAVRGAPLRPWLAGSMSVTSPTWRRQLPDAANSPRARRPPRWWSAVPRR